MDENTMIGMNDTEYDEFVAGSAAETIKRLGPVRKIDIKEFLDNFDPSSSPIEETRRSLSL